LFTNWGIFPWRSSSGGSLEVFSRFGPRLIGKVFGETEYVLSAIPLGGYVKMLGESEKGEDLSPEDKKRSFQEQPPLRKMAIVAAGPFTNFIFAIIVFALIYTVGVPVSTSMIGDVREGSAAFKAGMLNGDVIVAINDREISRWSELADVVSKSSGGRLSISVDRGGKFLDLLVTPELVKAKNLFGEEVNTYQIGVGISDETIIERQGPVGALYSGFEQTWGWTKLTCLGIVKIIQGVVSPKELGGPILIAQMAGTQVRKGFLPFIFLMAVLSVNLGVLNLLPIPVLDGGHLCFFLIEVITGREVSVKVEGDCTTGWVLFPDTPDDICLL